MFKSGRFPSLTTKLSIACLGHDKTSSELGRRGQIVCPRTTGARLQSYLFLSRLWRIDVCYLKAKTLLKFYIWIRALKQLLLRTQMSMNRFMELHYKARHEERNQQRIKWGSSKSHKHDLGMNMKQLKIFNTLIIINLDLCFCCISILHIKWLHLNQIHVFGYVIIMQGVASVLWTG